MSNETIAWSDQPLSPTFERRVATAGGGEIVLRPMVGEDMTGIDFQPAAPEGVDYGNCREVLSSLEPGSLEHGRLRASFYSQMGRIGYFPSLAEAERLLQLALDAHGAGDAPAANDALAAGGFAQTATFEYPEQGRTVHMWKRHTDGGIYELTVEADGSVGLSYEANRASHCDNLLRVDFNLGALDGRRIPLFWPDFVTPATALAMAVSAAAAHEAAPKTRRNRR